MMMSASVFVCCDDDIDEEKLNKINKKNIHFHLYYVVVFMMEIIMHEIYTLSLCKSANVQFKIFHNNLQFFVQFNLNL